MSQAHTIGPDELRTLFLFERLDDEQLAWLAEHGAVERFPSGAVITEEGGAATCFSVLLDGEVALRRTVQGQQVEITRSAQRGSYFGATQAYIADSEATLTYSTGVTAMTDAAVLQLPASELGAAMRSWFPMATHLLEGLFFGLQRSQQLVGQRERLLALGSLSAGLTHELNNPAAAAVRATSALRDRVAKMRHKLAQVASGPQDPRALQGLIRMQEEAVERVASAPKLSPMAASDLEDEVADWLEDHGVTDAWELAPTFAAAGLAAPWLDEVATCTGDDGGHLEGAVRWLNHTVETELLMNEIEDATNRISGLVGAAKQYSQLDRAPFQVVDVHELLDSTLVMLARKLDGVTLVKDYDRTLPPLPCYAAELNQVWTNLVDNAIGAMGGAGTLTVRTSRDAERLVVVVHDTGPGVPDDLQERIFEPFFTTKPVGEGTGLGLDISWRIVVNKHHGDLRVDSRPGDTTFTVRLPLAGPDGEAAVDDPEPG